MAAFSVVFGVVGTAGAASPQPYGKNDAGGFRNVLPPGSHGVDNLTDYGTFLGSGSTIFPPHWIDQQPLYENLLYADPTLTDAQIPNFYKDATFGVKPGHVESTIHPKAGVTITRDTDYGVPHIYGTTRADTEFGAGYAGAQDRLFLMDVLRHTGRAELSSFLGGSNLGSDIGQWKFAPYTEADFAKQLKMAPKLYGKAGKQAVADVRSYVAGINAYIAAAQTDPSLMPAEYTLLGKALKPWHATDVIATASLVGGIFGKGGGREVDSALVLKALEKRFGRAKGRSIWFGFREKNDPEAPTTIKKRYPYESTSPFAKRGLALPDGSSVTAARTSSRRAPRKVSYGSSPSAGIAGIGRAISKSLRHAHSSNWELVSRKHSETGHPLAVMGPQVGYYVPQILMEEDLHGPGIDARGTAFAGVNLYVQLGHGRDYAWSATSAGSDNVDTFAEVLCHGDKFHYIWRGKCRKMQKLTKTNSWTPNAIDSTPAGSATLTAYRTVHGIIQSYGRVHGKKVAFASARTTYFHEADSVIGFSELNNPKFVSGPASSKRPASDIGFNFNWAYVDSNHIAYYLSGNYPERAKGTSPDFPILGTGKYDWRGFNPKTHTENLVPFAQHPQAVDPPMLVSWNNKQAPGWSAADDQYGYGPFYRSQMIGDKISKDIKGGRRMKISELVQSTEESATQDIRGLKLLPTIFKAIGTPSDPGEQAALADLHSWFDAGAHRRDLDQNGVYEHNSAVELMDAWWPKLVEAEFKPTLGANSYDALQTMLSVGDGTGGAPHAPAFSDGWWGYVSKDLRTVFGPKPKGAYPRAFCGHGSKSACRTALQNSLAAALAVTPADQYGHGDCTSDPEPSCYDMNRSRVTAAIGVPPFPFQNRPTFQQVIVLKKHFAKR